MATSGPPVPTIPEDPSDPAPGAPTDDPQQPPPGETDTDGGDEDTATSVPPPAETTQSTEPTELPTQPTTSEVTQPTEEPSTSVPEPEPEPEPTSPSTTSIESSSSIPEESTSVAEPSSTEENEPPTTTEIITSTNVDSTATSVVVITRTRSQDQNNPTSSTATADPTPINPGGGGSGGGLDSGAKIAIGVVVPIVSIAILAVVALFFWKRRKTKRAAEEERRKEVEDYSYNPNADPTIPTVGMADGGYDMREDSSGYRGWGTTLAGSTGRKASTTMSGGGLAYTEASSPTQGHASVSRSDDAYVPEGEILGAMGPSAANNRGTGVNRGPSNASSSYSAANRSDNSDGAMSYGNGANYVDQQGQGPYADNYSAPQEMAAAPVIRDNPARRNTRIENPAHYPQQSAGISQNF